MSDLFLGIDIGTSSAKAVLTDRGRRGRGDRHATAPPVDPPPGLGRARSGGHLVGRRRRALPGAARRRATAFRRRCASAASAPACWPPTRPFARCGRRSSTASTRARRARSTSSPRSWGRRRSSSAAAPRCRPRRSGRSSLWLRRNEPEVWDGTRRLLMASSFAVARLTGEYVLDHHSASQCDPLYELDRRDWIEEWAEQIAPGLELPRLLWPGEPAGVVTAAAAAETGIPAGTPGHGRHDRRLGGVARGRRPGGRRPDGHVRVDALPDRGHGASRCATNPCGARRACARAPTRWPPAWPRRARCWPGCATSRVRPSTT